MHARFYWRSICFLHFLRSQSRPHQFISRLKTCPMMPGHYWRLHYNNSHSFIGDDLVFCWFVGLFVMPETKTSRWRSHLVNYRPKKERFGSLLALLQFNNRAKRLLNGKWYLVWRFFIFSASRECAAARFYDYCSRRLYFFSTFLTLLHSRLS